MTSPIESVEIAQNLDETLVGKISALQEPALFFVSNNLYVNPTKVQNGDLLARSLNALLDIPPETLKQKFSIRTRRHLEIIRKMSIGTRDMVTKRIDAEMTAVRNRQIDPTETIYPFIKIEDNLVRYYPESNTL